MNIPSLVHGCILAALMLTGCCSGTANRPASSSGEEQRGLANVMAREMALQGGGTDSGKGLFSNDAIARLKAYKLFDPLPVPHPRYYDKIKNLQRREVERHYLAYNGVEQESEVKMISDREFWLTLPGAVELRLRGRLRLQRRT
jgi:hypothetical protein